MEKHRSLTRLCLGLLWQKFVLILTLVCSLLCVLIALAHFQNSESQHVLGAFSFIPPLFTLLFAVPALVGFVILRYARGGLIILLLTGFNILWNEDYHLLPTPYYDPVPAAPSQQSLRVVAWNVQSFFFGMESVVHSIQESGADVLLLSEVNLKPSEQARFLRRVEPYHAVLSENGDSAILSRLPIVNSYEVELPTRQASLTRHNSIEQQKSNKARSFLHGVVQVDQQLLHVMSIRFIAGRAASEGLWDTIQWGLYLWQQQDREVQFFRSYVRKLQGPYLFGGDLNAIPASRTIKMLEAVGVDTYMAHHQWGDYTFKTKIWPSSKEKDLPVMRLDYIFASSELKSLSSERLTHIKNSDHFPLMTQFLKPNSPRLVQTADL